MYLNQTPTGFNLGENLDYKLVLRESGSGEGGPSSVSTHLFPRSSGSVLTTGRMMRLQ